MNDISLITFWDWLALQSTNNTWVTKIDAIEELGLDIKSFMLYMKDLKENNLIKIQKNDKTNKELKYQVYLKLSPSQVAAANYIGISMRSLEKYCTLDLKKEKNILLAAADFDQYKESERKKLVEKMYKEKFEHKMENAQKANKDLFALLSLADEIIVGQDKGSIEKEVAKSIKKEIQSLVKLLVK